MKKKIKFDKPKDTLKVEVPYRGSGFFNGAVLGALTGAVGFFLYGTKKGKAVKNKLVKQAKEELKNLKGEIEKGSKAIVESKNLSKKTTTKPKTVKTTPKKKK